MKEKKMGKFDVVCFICGEVIKGALRETSQPGDYEGTTCCDENEKWCHLKCLNLN